MLNRDDAIEYFVVLLGRQIVDYLARVANTNGICSKIAV